MVEETTSWREGGTVAVNIIVWRSGEVMGMYWIMVSMLGRNPAARS